MRPVTLGIVAAGALALAAAGLHGRLRADPFARAAQPAPRGPLVATLIDPDTITTTGSAFGEVAYRVPLPAAVGEGDSVELRFRAPLDGARVEAVGEGPRTRATLLRKRVGGDTVVVPLTAGRIDAVELRVRHNFRAPPIVREAVVMAAVTPPAVDRPPAASPRSTR